MPEPQQSLDIRDRIVEFKRVPASELVVNEANWRLHPEAQRQALAGVLEEVGVAGVCTAYYSERNGGKLTLIDGHLRAEDFALDWPTIILDVNDDEADILLATHDSIGALAKTDPERLRSLLDTINVGSKRLDVLLEGLRSDADKLIAANTAPDEFPEHDENIECDFRCPKCGYEWSGKTA